MNWNDLRSHRDQIDMLRRAIGRGRMTHAWLFVGPAGIGKSRFARIFTQCLFCKRHTNEELLACGECSGCRQMAINSHPDFFVVQCPEGKAEIPVQAFIGPPEKRNKEGLICDLSLRPMEADRRVALIDDANRMNEEGANAMLKTLEEPPPDSILILIADNLEAILPTIRSRCQVVRFSPLSELDVAELLVEHELCSDPVEAQAIAAMSDGSLQTASRLLNPTLRELRQQLYERLSSAEFDPLETSATITARLDEISSGLPELRRNSTWVFRFAQEFYRQVVLRLAGDPTAARFSLPEADTCARRLNALDLAGTEQAMDQFDRCLLAESQIEWNITPTKVVELLISDLARMSRSGRVRASVR